MMSTARRSYATSHPGGGVLTQLPDERAWISATCWMQIGKVSARKGVRGEHFNSRYVHMRALGLRLWTSAESRPGQNKTKAVILAMLDPRPEWQRKTPTGVSAGLTCQS